MAPRFKLDENLPRRVEHALRLLGFDVETAVSEHLAGSTDPKLLSACIAERRVLITLDLDFANPLTYDPRPTAGVAVLRLAKDHGPSEVNSIIERLLDELTSHDIVGSLWIVRVDRVRVWKPRDASDEWSAETEDDTIAGNPGLA